MCERQPSTPDPKRCSKNLLARSASGGIWGVRTPPDPMKILRLERCQRISNGRLAFSLKIAISVSHIIQLSENSRFPVKTK